jgi:predicted small lipoprotein YifL
VKAPQVLVTAAALVALAGCGSKPAAERPDSATPSPAPSASASLDAETLDATGAYLTALGRLDGALVADQRAALDRGAETCLDIADQKPESEQEQNVASRFAVDPAQAKKILGVAKSSLCLE